MDKELRFIAALLNANRNEQERFFIQQIPQTVFVEQAIPAAWVYSFREKHGSYPSAKAFNHKFGEKLLRPKDNLAACLQPVLDAAMFEQMRDLTTKIKDLIDKGMNIQKAMQTFKDAASRLTSFSVDYVDENFSTSKASLAHYREVVKYRNDQSLHYADTPWPTLNKMVKYFLPGEVIALAARTNIGKTWLTLDWAYYLALKKLNVLYITKEMTTDSLRNRLEALAYKLPYDDFRGGTLRPADLRRWRVLRKNNLPLNLILSGDETVEGVGLAHIVSKVQQYRPQILFVDGAYLIHPEGLSNRASPVERLSFLSNRFKALAKALKVIIVVVLQMNRKAEKTGAAGGSLSEIYGADAWAQDSDFVLIAKGRRGSSVRTVSLEKGREAAIGEFNTRFELEPFPCFKEMSGALASTPQTVVFQGVK